MTNRAKLWVPTPEDMENAERAYLEYATGVDILHDPTHAIHTAVIEWSRGYTADESRTADIMSSARPETIVASAERLMWDGLTSLVRYANPPELRHSLLGLKSRYMHAGPVIMSVLDTVVNSEIDSEITERLFDLDSALADQEFAPLPLKDEAVYKHVAASAMYRVTTRELIGDFLVDGSLQRTVPLGRHLNYGTIMKDRDVDRFVEPIKENLARTEAL